MTSSSSLTINALFLIQVCNQTRSLLHTKGFWEIRISPFRPAILSKIALAVGRMMRKSLCLRYNSSSAVKFSILSNGNSLKWLWLKSNVKRDEAIESKAVSLTWEILLLGIDKNSSFRRPDRRFEDIEVNLLRPSFNIFRLTKSENIPSGSVCRLFLVARNLVRFVIPLNESTSTIVKLLSSKCRSSRRDSPLKAFPSILDNGFRFIFIVSKLDKPLNAFCGTFESWVSTRINVFVTGGIEAMGMVLK